MEKILLTGGKLLDQSEGLVMAQKDISLAFKGSKNQRIIDMKHYRQTGEITELM